MPAKTTFKKSPGGNVYVYLTLRAYRNAAGKPTSDEAAIGKLASDGVSLIPNQRYFEIFGTKHSVPESSVAFGDSATLWLIADTLGVASCLKDATGGLASSVLLAASYMALKGNVMCHIDNFCEESWTADSLSLDSPRTSELFGALDFACRASFFRRWIDRRKESEYIAYDVTSLSTYSGGIEDAEWGHNRDGEDLCQINLGMFFGEATHLPLYFETYQGSVLDKTHLAHIMASAHALGIEKSRFVFDRGFVSADNLAYVSDNHLSFVTALPTSRKVAQVLIADATDHIHTSANRLEEQDIYAVSKQTRLDGLDLTSHIFYSPYKAAGEEEIIYGKLSRLESELEKMVSAKKIAKCYRDFFDVSAQGGLVSFSKNHTKIDACLARAGYFILITNDKNLDALEALKIYRGKDVIEKAFCNMKNYLDFRRMRTHNGLTTDGKLFVGFIALILRCAIREALSSHKATEKMSVGVAMRDLRKLKRITYSDGSVLHTAITKTQRQILDALGIDIEALLALP